MDTADNHYTFLGLELFASTDAVEEGVERVSKQANALANTSPARSHELRERIREIKRDLLSSAERRDAYNNALIDAQMREQASQPADIPVTALWETTRSVSGATRTAADTRAGQPPPAERSSAVPVPAPGRRNPWPWIVIGLVIVVLISAGGGYAVASGVFASHPTPTPTATPAPTSTPLPTSTATPKPVPTARPRPTAAAVIPQPTVGAVIPRPASERPAVEAAIQAYSQTLAQTAHTSDCSGMSAVATGVALQREENVCSQDQATGAHKDIINLSPPVTENVSIAGNSATVVVRKHQDILFYPNGCDVPDDTDPCAADHPNTQRDVSYTATYYLIKQGGQWLVSDFSAT